MMHLTPGISEWLREAGVPGVEVVDPDDLTAGPLSDPIGGVKLSDREECWAVLDHTGFRLERLRVC